MPKPMDNLDDRRKYANAVRLLFERECENLADDLISGKISLEKWHKQMKQLIRKSHKQMFVTGKGGVQENIFEGDFGMLGTPVREQYKYLKKFAEDIYNKSQMDGSLGFVKNRAKLYIKASQASFWRSAVPVSIPQFPRDGGTECKSNCNCYLDIDYETVNGVDVAVLVTWQLRPAEHCDDCRRLNSEWNPLRLPITNRTSSIRQATKFLVAYAKEDQIFSAELFEFLKVGEHASIDPMCSTD